MCSAERILKKIEQAQGKYPYWNPASLQYDFIKTRLHHVHFPNYFPTFCEAAILQNSSQQLHLRNLCLFRKPHNCCGRAVQGLLLLYTLTLRNTLTSFRTLVKSHTATFLGRTPPQLFSDNFCKISQNSCSVKRLQTAPFEGMKRSHLIQ